MGNWSELLRTILDRGFFFSLYGGVFCGGLFLAQQFGFEIPPEVMRWVIVAFIACVSFVIVQGPVSVYAAIKRKQQRIDNANAVAENARRNMSALLGDEKNVLSTLLGDDAPKRFKLVHTMTAYPLFEKGVLIATKGASGGPLMVELDPWIYERRNEIRAELGEVAASV